MRFSAAMLLFYSGEFAPEFSLKSLVIGLEKMRKIVITGIGIISPLGLGKESFWEFLRSQEHSLSQKPYARATSSREARLIRDFDEQDYMDAKTSKYAPRAEKLALASSKLALADARLDHDSLPEMRLGVVIGSMTSNLRAAALFDQQVLRGEASFVDPSLVPSGIMNSLSGIVSIKNGIRGFHVPIAAGEASGAQAIQFALMQLENGRADAVLAGGVDEICDEFRLIDCVKNVPPDSRTGEGNERPRIGKGSVYPLSEASTILLLESDINAARRGARAYAECVGFGCSYSPTGTSNRRTALRAALRALERACRGPEIGSLDIDLIFASLNGGPDGDCVEMEALSQFFGCRMPEVTCIKFLLGDSLGASGALQVAAAALAIKESAMPWTANYSNGRFEAAPTQRDRRSKEVKQVLVSSFSDAGHMNFLVLRKLDG